MEYSDNIDRVSTNTQEDFAQTVELEVTLEEESKNLIADANINVEHTVHSADTLDDETSLTSGFGLLSLAIVEDFISWELDVSRTDTIRDTAAEVDRDDREYRTIIRTGPSVTYGFRADSDINFNLNYILVENSDDAVSDSERMDTTLGYEFRLNSITRFFADAFYEDVLDGDGAEETEEYRLSVGAVRTINNGEISLTLGRERTTFETRDDLDANLIDLVITKDGLLNHDVELAYQEELSDSTIGFSTDEASDDGDGTTRAVRDNDFIERKRFTLSVDRELDSLAYDVEVIVENEHFEFTDSLEQFRSAGFGISPKVNSRFFPRFSYTQEYQDFGIRRSLGEDESQIYEFSFDYVFIEDLELNFSVGYEKRHNATDQTRELEEIFGELLLTWNFL